MLSGVLKMFSVGTHTKIRHDSTNEHYKSISLEDRRAEKIITYTIAKVDGHYCVGLLWKQAEPKLPFNRHMAQI